MKFSLWMLALAGLCAATAAHDPPPPAETEIHYRSRGKGRLKMSDGARHTMAPSPLLDRRIPQPHGADGIVQPPHEDNDGLKNADPKSLSGPAPKPAPDPATVDKLTKSRIHAPMTMAGGNIFARKKKEPSAFCVVRPVLFPPLRDSTVALLRVSRRNSRFFFSVTLSAARLTRHLFDNFSESG